MLLKSSDVPDSLSGFGSGRILPFLSDIWTRPDLDIKKDPDPDPVPARSRFKKKEPDLDSKKEHTEKYFFKNKLCVN